MFKPGYFGKNPPKWWIGQVPLNQTDNKTDPRKWGDRVKVRIVGYHPREGAFLSDDDLPWALISKPTSQGNLNKGSVSICGGEWVMGLFLDDDCEQPMIMGILGRSVDSYEISLSDQNSQGSTEFKTVNIYSGLNSAAAWNFLAGPSPGQDPFIPDASLFA